MSRRIEVQPQQLTGCLYLMASSQAIDLSILQKLKEPFIIYLRAIGDDNLFEEFPPLTAH